MAALIRQCVMLAVVAMCGFGAFVPSAQAVKPPETPKTIAEGRIQYERSCLLCHGAEGRGDGPAAFFIGAYSGPRPKDFTSGNYKLRSTPTGELPTDQDLFDTITNGIPGLMPSFSSLSEEHRWRVIFYFKTFAPAFQEKRMASLVVPDPPFRSSNDAVNRGRTLYQQHECEYCHGPDGRGDEPEAYTNGGMTVRGILMPAPDLTHLKMYKHGTTPRDLYRTLITGMDGSPMPSYGHAFKDHQDDLWNLIYYVLSLSEKERGEAVKRCSARPRPRPPIETIASRSSTLSRVGGNR